MFVYGIRYEFNLILFLIILKKYLFVYLFDYTKS